MCAVGLTLPHQHRQHRRQQQRRHAEGLCARLDAARNRTIGLAQRHGARFDTPPAGLFGWVDAGVDTEALAQRLLDHGWLTAPGHLFYPERRTSTSMRINFAATQDASFWQAFARERVALLR